MSRSNINSRNDPSKRGVVLTIPLTLADRQKRAILVVDVTQPAVGQVVEASAPRESLT
jgi:hypothetical protein